MPITKAEDDPDVSAMVFHYGALEGGITRVGVWPRLVRGRQVDGAWVACIGRNLRYIHSMHPRSGGARRWWIVLVFVHWRRALCIHYDSNRSMMQ